MQFYRLKLDILQEFDQRLEAAGGDKYMNEIEQEMDLPRGTINRWKNLQRNGKFSNDPYWSINQLNYSIHSMGRYPPRGV